MIAFYAIAGIMLLAALAFVLIPLFRNRAGGEREISDAGSNVAVFRSQKREIEEDFARGVISASERDANLDELSARLLDEVPDGATGQLAAAPAAQKRPWLLIGLLAVLLPAVAISLYIKLGSTQALQPDELVSHAPPSGGDGKTGDAALSDKQILAMVDALAQKMEKNPADPKGWILLARSQSALGRFPEAVAAYEKAVKLLPNDATLYADFADALVMQQEGSFEGKPQMLIRKALELDPNYPKALALAGTAEMRLGNKTASLKHWEKLKTVVAQGSDDYRQVESIIAEVKGEKVDSIPLIQSASAPAAPAQPSPQTPSAAMQRQAAASQASPPVQAPAGNAAGAKITGKVTLSPDVASKLAATDTLFIFARAKEGPRMPLAVLKLPAPRANEFPKSFELTDAMAMAPGLNLSSFKEVIIEARVSKSGNAQLQSGDLNGVSSAVAPGAGNVVVTIAKVAP